MAKLDEDQKTRVKPFSRKEEEAKTIISVIPIETSPSQIEVAAFSFFPRYKGMLLALVSSVMFSLSALLVKFLKSYHPVTIALWRIQGAFLPSILLLIWKEVKHRRRKRRKHAEVPDAGESSPLASILPWSEPKKLKLSLLVLLRSILTCNALLLHFYSLKYLQIGDALVISSSTPVFVSIFAHYFLGESCGIVPIFSAITTIIGVVVIAKPPHIFGYEEFDHKTMIGTFLGLGCMLVATVSYLVLRYIRKVHYAVTNVAFGSWGTFENFGLALIFGVLSWPNCYKDWLAAFCLASLTFVGQMAIILAMKHEQAGPVSLVRTCDVIFAFFWQICVLDCWPEIYSWIGCSIVMFSLIVTGMRKWVEALDEDDAYRRRFFFLLL